jgi:hypothetical protein
MKDTALIIFAKQPVPGNVKTRMTPPLVPAEAASLYDAMVRDVLDKCRHLTMADLLLFHDDRPGSREFFTNLLPNILLMPQEGADLGERLERAFDRTFALGYGQAVIMGTDSPDLPLPYIEEGIQSLAADIADAVFGPTADGGYCLLGLSAPHPTLFRDIPWSTAQVLERSLQKCDEAGLRTELLPRWHDLDTVADLLRLPLECPAAAPRTCRAIAALREAGRL